jgi:hypothetical protein
VSDRNDSQRAAFDDDRLLDYALGLEDDPELAAALSHSARLRERLADLKSDLAAIETELRRAIPPIDESYAQPGAARWSRLRRSFGEGEAVRRRPLRGRRLTAAFVTAALALAIVIGVVAIMPHGPSSSSSTSSGASKNAAAAQAPTVNLGAESGQSSAAPGAAPALGKGGSGSADSVSAAVARSAAAYRDVAVVRAGPVTGAQQSFTVVRVLKGSPPASFSLVLRSTGSAPLVGSLAIAYLRPLVASTVPSASVQPSATTAPSGLPDFAFDDQRALLVALPANVAPAAVRMPK